MGEVCKICQVFWVICAQKCWDENETLHKETIKWSMKQSCMSADSSRQAWWQKYESKDPQAFREFCGLTRLHLSCLCWLTFFPHSFFIFSSTQFPLTPVPLPFPVPCPPSSHYWLFFPWLSHSFPPHTTIMLFRYSFVLYPISLSCAFLKHTACKAL